MFPHLIPVQFGDTVEAQIVFIDLDLGNKIAFQSFEPGPVDLAFKNGFLYPLANTLTQPGNAAQTTTAVTGFGVDVVADNNQHQRIPKGKY